MTIEKSYRRARTPARIMATVVMVVLAAGILGWLVYRERDVLLHYDWHVRWEMALASFGLFSLDLGLVALVWAWVLIGLGGQGGVWKHIRYYCIANIAKRLPGTVWYVASRTVLYQKEGVEVARVVVASGVELALMIMSGIVATMLFAAPLVQSSTSWWGIGVALLVSVMLVQPKFVGWVLRKLKIPSNLTFRYVDIVKWFLTYLFAWIVGGVVLYTVISTFVIIQWDDLAYTIGCWSLTGIISSALFFAPSNLGVTEVTLSLLLSKIMPGSVAVLVAVFARLLLFLYEIIWAAICLKS